MRLAPGTPPARDPARLVRVFARGETSSHLSNSSYPVYTDYRDQSSSFASLAAYADFVAINLELPGRPVERVKAALVLAGAALLASLHPAVRATRVNPIEVLRSE